MLSPDVVSEEGRSFVVVDIRERAELSGPLGRIPGSAWIPAPELALALYSRTPEAGSNMSLETPIVLVSRRGERAATAARQLEEAGISRVAALCGGLEGWHARGLTTVHTPAPETAGLLPERVRIGGEGALTEAMIREHLGDPATILRVKLAAFLLQNRTSCIDGRDARGIVGTPGGDAGEFLLGIASIESLRSMPVPTPVIERLFAGYLATFGRFYMHSDRQAVEALVAALTADPRFAGQLPAADASLDVWREWLVRPPEGLRDPLVDHLLEPSAVGCGHLRRMIECTGAYGIRPAAIRAFFAAFFRRYWAGDVDANYVILEGSHAECGNLRILVPGPVWPFTQVPLVSPAGARQLFVSHPQVVSALRRQIAGFLVLEPGLGLGADEHDRLHSEMEALAARQLKLTLGHLAAGLPVFEARFDRDGGYEVVARPPIDRGLG